MCNANLEEWKSSNDKVQGIIYRPAMPRADFGSVKGKSYKPDHAYDHG